MVIKTITKYIQMNKNLNLNDSGIPGCKHTTVILLSSTSLSFRVNSLVKSTLASLEFP